MLLKILLERIKMEEQTLKKVLQILEEQYVKDPPYYVGASRLRARLDMPVDELRYYAWFLKSQGYAYESEGLPTSGSFIVRLNHNGHVAYQNHQISL